MRLIHLLAALILVILGFHLAGNIFGWYDNIWWFDIPMHIAGGLWIGLLFFYLFFERQRALSAANLSFIQTAFLCIGFVAFIGVGWECYEYLSEVFVTKQVAFGGSIPGLHFDTLKDLFNDTVGGALASLWYVYLRRRSKGGG